MRSGVVLIATATAALVSACSTASTPAPRGATPMTQEAPQTVGYLPEARLADLAATVPAPSADGSPEQIADRALSDRYRALERSDRWLLATSHAELSPKFAPQHFDCALGVRFAAAPTPRLTALFDKLLKDANGAAELAKARAFRPRPVGVDPTRPACTTITAAGRASASYPSGSATVGAAYGEAMAALDPAHAAAAREDRPSDRYQPRGLRHALPRRRRRRRTARPRRLRRGLGDARLRRRP